MRSNYYICFGQLCKFLPFHSSEGSRVKTKNNDHIILHGHNIIFRFVCCKRFDILLLRLTYIFSPYLVFRIRFIHLSIKHYINNSFCNIFTDEVNVSFKANKNYTKESTRDTQTENISHLHHQINYKNKAYFL